MDRSLAVFLRALQTSSEDDEAASLLPAATSLLLSLSNPLNLQLITSQLLRAPALWKTSCDLRTCQAIFSVFYTAALQVSQPSTSPTNFANRPSPPIDTPTWVTAVVKGADEKSPRWRHLLVLGATHLGLHGQERQPSSSPALRSKIEAALVIATNLALQEEAVEGTIGGHAVAFTLSYTFELLANFHRTQLNYDLLLPVLVQAVFTSPEALEQGYWLGIIDRDVMEVENKKFSWSARSTTYVLLQEIQQRPLMASLGPITRLLAHSVLNVHDSTLVMLVMDRIVDFARTMSVSWRQNKLSELEPAEEVEFMDGESITTTLPTLWHTLKLSFLATIISLKAVISRMLADPILADAAKAHFLAAQSLHVLRNLHFAASRLGLVSSSQYLFIKMAAIDLLSHSSRQTEHFVESIRPVEQGQIPAHPADRCLDLFFFNTVEYLIVSLPSKINEEIVLVSTMPYLAAGGNKLLMDLFEAAHSVTLAVLAAPQNADMASRYVPFYLDTLFKCFPNDLSSRQFRLAFKTIVRLSSPPSPLAQSKPLLPSILLEAVLERATNASPNPLPAAPASPNSTIQGESISEQATLVLALVDSLCFLHPDLLQEWLPLTASVISSMDDLEMQILCQEHFWEELSSGIMDDERAVLCVTWWNSRGGREQLCHSNKAPLTKHEMSGALSMDSKL